MEIDPEDEVTRHLDEIRQDLSEQVSASMVNEINRQLEMSHGTPGAYESALFDRFIDVMRNSEPYDRVVFDTSPTGSTLRLLGLPDLLEDWIDRLMHKRRTSIDLFEKAAIGNNEPRRVMEGDPVLARLQERKEFFEFAGSALHDDAAFFLVVNPDELSLNETERAIDDLREKDLAVRGLVANKLTPSPDPGRERPRRSLPPRARRDGNGTPRDDPLGVRAAAGRRNRLAEFGGQGDLLADVAGELNIETAAEPPPTRL